MKCEGCGKDKETTRYFFKANHDYTFCRNWCKECLSIWRDEASYKLLEIDGVLQCPLSKPQPQNFLTKVIHHEV